MKTTLFSILCKKEKIHWNRTKKTLARFNKLSSKLTFGLIVVILGTLFHYCFAIMHTLFEIFLFIFMRKAFKNNLQKLALKV